MHQRNIKNIMLFDENRLQAEINVWCVSGNKGEIRGCLSFLPHYLFNKCLKGAGISPRANNQTGKIAEEESYVIAGY